MKLETTEWIDKAEGDWTVAQREMRAANPVWNVISFLAQQCAEKYLKAFLEEHNIAFGRIHDLVVLHSSTGGLGLHDLDYVVGQNIRIEYRYADGKRDQFLELATELVRLKVDAILVVGGTLAATKQATSTIPIVAATAGDLVGSGYVASLAKPGGNITGSTNIDADLSGKRLELLKEAFPKLSRVALLTYAGNRGDQDELKETQAAARALQVQIQSLEVKDRSQFQSAFSAMSKEHAEAFIITNNSFNFAHRRLVFELAAKNRLPSMCGRDAFVEHGCLISYAASRRDAFRRAAYFVDKILKGAKPAELPVQQPTKFELVINLKTAKHIGLTIPQWMLMRADRVIK